MIHSILRNIGSVAFKSNIKNLANLNKVIASGYTTLSKKNTIKNIEMNELNLETKLNDGFIQFNLLVRNKSYVKEFPYIWLRDHCKCSKCHNKKTDENEFDLSLIPHNIKPVQAKSLGTNNLEIICNLI